MKSVLLAGLPISFVRFVSPYPRRRVKFKPPFILSPPRASQVRVAFSPGYPEAKSFVPAAMNFGMRIIAGRRLKGNKFSLLLVIISWTFKDS